MPDIAGRMTELEMIRSQTEVHATLITVLLRDWARRAGGANPAAALKGLSGLLQQARRDAHGEKANEPLMRYQIQYLEEFLGNAAIVRPDAS